MNWIILSIVVFGLCAVIGYNITPFEQVFTAIVFGAIGVIIVSAYATTTNVSVENNYDRMQFETADTEIYQIKEMPNGQYYGSIDSEGKKSISVIIVRNDGICEEKTYTTDSLIINPDADQASITIHHEKAVSAEFLWEQNSVERLKSDYFIDISEVTKISEIIINIPKENIDTTDQYETDNATQQEPVHNFCPACGTETKEEWLFCGNCGNKIEK